MIKFYTQITLVDFLICTVIYGLQIMVSNTAVKLLSHRE